MTSRRCLLVVLAWLATACSDDGVHHLPDGPPGSSDAAIDAPGDSGPNEVALHVGATGTGSGTITSSPDGIACGTACGANFPRGTVVTLTAEPAVGSVFAGWSGECMGAPHPTCELTLDAAANVTATFTLQTHTITVTKAGAGTGNVVGGGLSCGATCTITVDHGTAVNLAATPANLSVFAGWGGACSGTTTCMLTITADTAITANFALDDVTLFITRGGNGAGTVTSSPAGIDCGTTCQKTYSAGQMTTLTAVPMAGSTFTGWSGGGCTGTAPCTLTLTTATTVTATFTLLTFPLTVARAGNGSGSVTSSPAGIACGTDCNELYNYGTQVTLTPVASTGSTFTGWGGACSGAGACVVTITAATAVTATFTLQTLPLTVSRFGTGAGTVTGPGIACGTTCMASVNYGTMVTLTAMAATGSTFAGWGGACMGMAACVVTMDMARSVTATFTLDTFTLAVSKAGTGTGTVNGGPINCGANCMATLGYGTMVTLTATANAADSFFAGWGGACSGSGTCVVTMDMARSVTATFTLNSYLLTVTKGGTGTGTVTGGAINCGATCTQMATHGTVITLTASPAIGSTFTGWSGACSGAGTCVVTMDMAKTVTATFAPQIFTLTVTRPGNGAGTVTGSGINCGTTCSAQLPYNTMVSLTAAPAAGSSFTGWGGACMGAGACNVTMDMARSVTATFTLDVTLTVSKGNSTGAGTVTGGAINCGNACSTSVPPGTMITLTAAASTTPATASTFNGWSGGGCSGTGACTVTLAASTTVTATFTLLPNIIFVTSTLQNGNLGGLAGADSICNARAQAVNLGGNYVAYLSSININTPIDAPSRVGSATGWVRTDGKPVANDIAQFAAGTLFNPPSFTETKVDVGTTNNTLVWTGTSTQGTYANACSAAAAFLPWQGTFGSANMGVATSTAPNVVDSDIANCGNAFRLYCLGTDRKAIAQ